MSRGFWTAVGCLLAVYAALAGTCMLGKSATFDECIHLPPGYAAWRFGDHRMNPDHPPLLRLWAAAPLLFMDVHTDPQDHAWKTRRPWEWGKRFLYRWNDADRLLGRGRLPVVALGVVLALVVVLWARRLGGPVAGVAAGLLCALNPDTIAHGSIITNDLAVALAYVLAVLAFERVTARVTAAGLLAAGVAVGAAVATKFSAGGLLPILALLAVVVALRQEPMLVPGRELAAPRAKLVALAVLFAAMGLVALATLWAAYGFHPEIAVDPEVDAAVRWQDIMPASPLARRVVELVNGRLLPRPWMWGFLDFLEHSQSRPSFLLGEQGDQGWWHYFPTTFALKTPIPLLLLTALALVQLARGAYRGREAWFLWLPPLFYFGFAMTRSINIGHRHLLPVYPFLFVACGVAVAACWPRGRAVRVALAALAAWYACDAARIYPHYLAYFNALGGGPEQGYRRLVDSNLDWGQDLPGLKRYLDKNGIGRVKLCYFGTADPSYYGIAADRLPGYQPPPPSTLVRQVRPGDVVAISATMLQGVYLDPEMQPLMALFRARQPIAQIGYSILVYRADFAYDLDAPLR